MDSRKRFPRSLKLFIGHRGWLWLFAFLMQTAHVAVAEEGATPLQRGATTASVPFKGPGITTGSRPLFNDGQACSQAKLALWLAHGSFAYTLLIPDQTAQRHEALTQDGATITIGGEGCRVRIRIERAE